MLTKDLRICNRKIPTYPLFMVSGAICDVVQAGIDYLIYSFLDVWLEEGRSTASWTLSYTLSIMLRHQSHRLLVFGDYEGGYFLSLTRTYMTYSSAIVVSMMANHFLVGYFKLSYRYAWFATMIFTGIYNYFTLRATWRVKKEPAPPTINSLGSPKSSRDRKDSVEVVSKNGKGSSLQSRENAARGASDDEYFSDSSGGTQSKV